MNVSDLHSQFICYSPSSSFISIPLVDRLLPNHKSIVFPSIASISKKKSKIEYVNQTNVPYKYSIKENILGKSLLFEIEIMQEETDTIAKRLNDNFSTFSLGGITKS